jgi:hypothetical protein
MKRRSSPITGQKPTVVRIASDESKCDVDGIADAVDAVTSVATGMM